MLVTPSDHYALHEEVATTIGEVRSFIDEVHRIAASRSCNVFWRGQSNHKWGITSSLVREASSPTVITDTNLRRAEREILDEAKAWVTAAPTRLPENDLEWLAFMQHHGIPTRM